MTPERARLYRRLLVAGAILLLVLLLWLAREVLSPFVIGGILAYLLLPPVRRLERLLPERGPLGRARRPLAILLVYLLVIVVVVAAYALVVPPLIRQIGQLAEQTPMLIEEVRRRAEGLLEQFHEVTPDPIEAAIESNLAQLGSAIASGLRTALGGALAWLLRTANVVLGLLVIPLWLFYVLKDEARGRDAFYALFPPDVRGDVKAIAGIVNGVLSRYIRGQLFLGLVIGLASYAAFTALGIPYALVLGIVNGLFELIPIIGPWLGAIPGVLVTLAVAPDKVGFVILFYILLQQVENAFLVPKIQGDAVEINPAILIMALVIAGSVFGVWGLLAAVPLTAIARDVFCYVHRRLSEPPTAAPGDEAQRQ